MTAAPFGRDEEILENCALTVCLRDVGRACRRLVGWREDLAQHNGLRRGGRGKRQVRVRSSKLAVAKTKGGCSFRQSTGERPTKTSSQGKPLDQEANALISTRYIECAEKHAAKLQGMIGRGFAKRMTE
jgi:hypothetical protein